MLKFNIYKLIHLVSVFSLLIALACGAVTEKAKSRWVAPVHGVSLLLILVAGFGMLAQFGMMASLPGWAIGKLVIWFVLGGSIAIARRKLLPVGTFLFLITALGGIAAALALWKP